MKRIDSRLTAQKRRRTGVVRCLNSPGSGQLMEPVRHTAGPGKVPGPRVTDLRQAGDRGQQGDASSRTSAQKPTARYRPPITRTDANHQDRRRESTKASGTSEPAAALTQQRRADPVRKTMAGHRSHRLPARLAETSAADSIPFQFTRMPASLDRATRGSRPCGCDKLRDVAAIFCRIR